MDFPEPLAPVDAGDFPRLDLHRRVLQNLPIVSGKADILCLCLGKSMGVSRFLSGNFLHYGGLLQKGQHPFSAGQGLVRVAGQAGQGRHRAKGAHHGNGTGQNTVKSHKAPRFAVTTAMIRHFVPAVMARS